MSVIERKADCPPVEAYIWDRVARDWGNFAGIERLSVSRLMELRGLVDVQIAQVMRDEETPNAAVSRPRDAAEETPPPAPRSA